MLAIHKEAFFKVADMLNCWIGLREPNPLADQWIGRVGYIAKGERCKAKTADNPSFRFAGLVTDPTLCPEAFTQATLTDALEKWKKFTFNNQLPSGFTRVESGSEKGLVKYEGAAIHADFDLMSINVADKNGHIGFTTRNDAHSLFIKAQPLLNHFFGSALIMHGSEFDWDGGIGARESEYVFYFGPKRQFKQTLSSMPQKVGTLH
ncbi:hypothetical protein [Runella aurantiaca]|uniref:Uncharacterized protein n=1 Tax=Runella aurantiaca TaxID=2282308 RepID=A0A369I892_9BACT|nr:hypothetical protein [Runella aurantiaca]RDB05100.1 hypothetical protein DVG78_14555 [Runella aurantiaca]